MPTPIRSQRCSALGWTAHEIGTSAASPRARTPRPITTYALSRTDSLRSTRPCPGGDRQMSGASWDIGMLPFQIGHRSAPSNAPLPDRLPFVAGVDEHTGLVVQRHDEQVSGALAEAYRLGSQ